MSLSGTRVPKLTQIGITGGDGFDTRSHFSPSVNALLRCSIKRSTLITSSFPWGPATNGLVGQKMLYKFLIASTYDYIWKTCLRMINRLDVLSYYYFNSINFPTIICSPNTCYWRVTTSVDSWEPRSFCHHHCSTVNCALGYFPVPSPLFYYYCCVTTTIALILLLLSHHPCY